ncbi:hypothetical protein B6U93_03805 [Candidatus Woesearchaeota archaeon ex4484_78]|nr:MAG: hypothetical protein B6U93_03805 [Candidatus Woesearchaeota archaeon ex4484_78]
MNSKVKEIIGVLEEMQNDPTVPKNVKAVVANVIKILQEEKDISVASYKALSALEELSDDNNMQSYTRTQLWDVASMLEKLT